MEGPRNGGAAGSKAQNTNFIVAMICCIGGLLIVLAAVLSSKHRQQGQPPPTTTAADEPAGPAREAGGANTSAPAAPGTAATALGSAKRFTEFPEAHPLRPAQDALNAGDVDGAMSFLSREDVLGSVDAGTRQRLWAAIQEASDTQLNRSPAADYLERVQTYWLPETKALPSTPPEGDPVGEWLKKLELLRSHAAEGGSLSLTPAQRAVHSRFSAALSAKQKALFPAIRSKYAELLNAQLFRRDVIVTTVGRRAQTLRFTGPLFVRNANIEDMQTELMPVLASMRFRRVEYRWSRSAGGTTYYDLDPPADADVTAR